MGEVRVGWLQQNVGYVGGAERSCRALVEGAPEWAEVVYCPPGKRPPRDVDVFVIQNCTTYGARWTEELALKPVIKQVRDPWYAGSSVLRRWLLDNAEVLIFSSPVQQWKFRYPSNRPCYSIPVPIKLDKFRESGERELERSGAIFIGRAEVFKGVMYAIDWALRNEVPLDIVGKSDMMDFGQLPGYIRLMGPLSYEQVVDGLGRKKYFVFFPTWPEAFGRTVVEAWAAGCELVVEGDVGATWWIDNEPERLGYEGPIGEFWAIVESVV